MGCQKLLQLFAPIISLIFDGLGGVTSFLKLNSSLVLNLRNWLGKEKNKENITFFVNIISFSDSMQQYEFFKRQHLIPDRPSVFESK
jgi:hypothetical protein